MFARRPDHSSRGLWALTGLLLVVLSVSFAIDGLRAQAPAGAGDAPVAAGLDHVPIAVANLDGAAERYRALGFALKPGRPHANGIRNEHAKFPDGTELELITVPDARDDLTATYRRHLSAGDGPAFLAFHAPSLNGTARKGAPGYIFFSGLNHSPTDRPEHFAHANGAESLIGVWLAGDDLSRERQLLRAMKAGIARQRVHAPDVVEADVATLGRGAVLLLPGGRQLVPNRPIVGATLRVKNLAATRAAIGSIAATNLQTASGPGWSSCFVPPAAAHGLWLEFREIR